MQLLYANDRNPGLELDALIRDYKSGIQRSFDLYLFTLSFYLGVVRHAIKDEDKKHNKHLPSDADRKFRARLFNNPLVQSIINNPQYKDLIKEGKKFRSIDSDLMRRIYYSFEDQESYSTYATANEVTNEDHRKMLLAFFKHCYDNELFVEEIDADYPNWIDDKSLVVGAIKKTIKSLPKDGDFFNAYLPDDETTNEFGMALLNYTYKESDQLTEYINPTLKNWDASRVAIIDNILLKMALSELILFETIPSKVTLNEYLDVSKLYSTEKSKEFINGILDRLMKDLTKKGVIKKSGRGLIN